MFQPVGSQPPSVYWRRRLVLLGAVVLAVALIVLTVSALAGGGGTSQGGSRTPTLPPASSTPPPTTHAATSTRPSSSSAGSSGSSSAVPTTCALSALQLTARTGRSSYSVGDDVLAELQVINTGSSPCSRDLADKQIELRVYNGTSRVWGSHDCAVQSGTSVRTLAVGRPYLFQVDWSGLTSSSGCKQGTRQRVGAGSYTLYASLAGKQATAAQFEIS